MTLPVDNIAFSAIQTEFTGGVNPISLSEYYRGGSYVPIEQPANPFGTFIPTSGPISITAFKQATLVQLFAVRRLLSTYGNSMSYGPVHTFDSSGNLYFSVFLTTATIFLNSIAVFKISPLGVVLWERLIYRPDNATRQAAPVKLVIDTTGYLVVLCTIPFYDGSNTISEMVFIKLTLAGATQVVTRYRCSVSGTAYGFAPAHTSVLANGKMFVAGTWSGIVSGLAAVYLNADGTIWKAVSGVSQVDYSRFTSSTSNSTAVVDSEWLAAGYSNIGSGGIAKGALVYFQTIQDSPVRWATLSHTENVSIDGVVNCKLSGDRIVCGHRHPTAGQPTAFVARIQSDELSASIVWQKEITGVSNSSLVDVATDSADNVYVVGNYTVSDRRPIILKFDASGNLLWQREVTTTYTSSTLNGFTGVVLDQYDGPYVGGTIWDTVVEPDLLRAHLFRLPADGSGLGVIGNGAYAVSTLTIQNASLTLGTAPLQLLDTPNISMTTFDPSVISIIDSTGYFTFDSTI